MLVLGGVWVQHPLPYLITVSGSTNKTMQPHFRSEHNKYRDHCNVAACIWKVHNFTIG